MKERLITFGMAIAALLLVYALFLPKPDNAAGTASRPLSGEAGPDGYQILWRWLAAENIPEVSSKSRYQSLVTRFNQSGNVLLTTLPNDNAARKDEIDALQIWVERGNTLLVVAALDDTPKWSLGSADHLVAEFKALTGTSTSVVTRKMRDKTEKLAATVEQVLADRDSVLEPLGSHALLQKVRSLSVNSELPSSRWQVHAPDDVAMLNLAALRGSEDAGLWLRRSGKGVIVVIGFAGIFNNSNIEKGDNATLLANVLAWARSPHGTVIFDDGHQGAVDYYDAKAFFADPRLHRTLAWLALLWFVFVLGIQRLRYHGQDWRTTDITAFIGTSGEFLASTITPRAAAARLVSNFFNVIRSRLHLPEDGTPEWQWLAAQPRTRAADVSRLKMFCDRLDDGKPVDLLQLQALLCQLREQIT